MKECIQKTAVGDFCRSVGQNEWVTFVSDFCRSVGGDFCRSEWVTFVALWAKSSFCLGLFRLFIGK